MFMVLVPVKRTDRAKTRLAQSGVANHHRLAVAFAWDTIAAALASPFVKRVYVITDEPGLVPPEAHLLDDTGAGDLNRALTHAEHVIRADQPDICLAALCADLPALTPHDLSTALSSAASRTSRRSFVADKDGTGTTLLAAPQGLRLAPLFGPDSARRHDESGANALNGPLTTLRADVDTATDLTRVRQLGVGFHTAKILADLAADLDAPDQPC